MRCPKLRFNADSSHNEQRQISSACTRVTARSRQATLGPERAAALIGPCSCHGYPMMDLVASQHLHAFPLRVATYGRRQHAHAWPCLHWADGMERGGLDAAGRSSTIATRLVRGWGMSEMCSSIASMAGQQFCCISGRCAA